jgi:hypothetical protein
MKHLNCILVLLLVMGVGCQSDNPLGLEDAPKAETATVAGSGYEKPMVPFHASEHNTILVVPPFIDETNSIGHFEFPGVINGTHLGQSTIDGIAAVDFGAIPFVETGESTITAANGDILTFAFDLLAFPGAGEGDVDFSGPFWFTSNGTGRFANASGGGTLVGTANTIAGVGQYDMDGEISFGKPYRPHREH